MKKVLSIITITAAVAVVMASCKGGSSTKGVSTQDTTGLAAFNAWKMENQTPVAPVASTKTVKRQTSSNGSISSSSTHEAQTTTQKKGWSKSAKGAVIGGASGAVLGAVINKRNRVAGGVIGGILGGGVGYGIGRSKDKKDGRY